MAPQHFSPVVGPVLWVSDCPAGFRVLSWGSLVSSVAGFSSDSLPRRNPCGRALQLSREPPSGSQLGDGLWLSHWLKKPGPTKQEVFKAKNKSRVWKAAALIPRPLPSLCRNPLCKTPRRLLCPWLSVTASPGRQKSEKAVSGFTTE